jgi:hypothetical protein
VFGDDQPGLGQLQREWLDDGTSALDQVPVMDCSAVPFPLARHILAVD